MRRFSDTTEVVIAAAATMAAFGAAYLVAQIRGWGVFAAAALIGSWLMLVMFAAVRQQREDRQAGLLAPEPSPTKPPRWLGVLYFLLLAAGAACYLYAIWLGQTGGSQETISTLKTSAVGIVGVGGGIVTFIGSIHEEIMRRQTEARKSKDAA